MNLNVGQTYIVADTDSFAEYSSVDEPVEVAVHSISGLEVVMDVKGEEKSKRESIEKDSFRFCCDNRILVAE